MLSSDHRPVGVFLRIPVQSLPPANVSVLGQCLCILSNLCAKNLPAMDKNGSCDAYLEAYGSLHKKKKTGIVKENKNPSWGKEQLVLELTSNNPQRLWESQTIIRISDKDKINSDDVIGFTVLPFWMCDSDVSGQKECEIVKKASRAMSGVAEDGDEEKVNHARFEGKIVMHETKPVRFERKILRGTKWEGALLHGDIKLVWLSPFGEDAA